MAPSLPHRRLRLEFLPALLRFQALIQALELLEGDPGGLLHLLAFRVYGDVKYTGFLMQANFPHLDTFVFDAGVVLQTPDLPEDDDLANAPIWRTTA